ncbi:DUF2913 family protein [Enterobacter cloacae complex sp. ECC445]|uniref:DUF2913 family protein n=1 Tax=Enterobacter cloacae complex sp. ECC445 TaxID=2913213 RepID=UPI001F30CF2D|nr:DUF2913 family protein [Enterobacter cloacae complex sp. ECC445]MCG0456685.1 DUF2913 family protein [Enterobacter cloacae complex sp. ECC445]
MTELTTKRPDTELAHLAWCIIVAVKLARKEGKSLTPLQTHMFIMQWLSTAQKRKLFPKSLAPDIIWLQAQGKQKGPAARLYSKVEYIWLASSGELASQSTLFRFTCMIDTLRSMGWQDHLLSDTEWQEGWKCSTEVSAVYTQKSQLHRSFTEAGELMHPLEVRLTGIPDGIFPLLMQCGLKTLKQSVNMGYTILLLQPDDMSAIEKY